MNVHWFAALAIVQLALAASKGFTLSTINAQLAQVIVLTVRIRSAAFHVMIGIFYRTPHVFHAAHPVPSVLMNQFVLPVCMGTIYLPKFAWVVKAVVETSPTAITKDCAILLVQADHLQAL